MAKSALIGSILGTAVGDAIGLPYEGLSRRRATRLLGRPWLSHPADLKSAITGVIECGGDADSTAAIVGGIVGASVGREGIPSDWLDGLCEWPRSVEWMERLAEQLASAMESGRQVRAMRLPALAVVMRNLFFLAVVLCHGFRRLLPPY